MRGYFNGHGGSHHNGLCGSTVQAGAGTLTICGSRLGVGDADWWRMV